MEIGLVSCTKRKKATAAKPRDLYEPSALFRKARSYVTQTHDEWYVLSAKHHVLDPDGPAITPYNETLTNAGIDDRREWSRKVVKQLDERELLVADNILVIHAGAAYYGELLPLLETEPVDIAIPTEGLRMGETLAWYNERI